jgi:hypothetical protein
LLSGTSGIKFWNLRTSYFSLRLLSSAKYAHLTVFNCRLLLLKDMKKLEDTFEQSLTREEQELAVDADDPMLGDSVSLKKSVRDMKAKYEVQRAFYLPSYILQY